LGFVSATVRAVVMVDMRPPGVVVVRLFATGACMPNRGSGPSSRRTRVPSASVVTLLPLVPTSCWVVVPSGAVITRRVPPAGMRSTW
jgi:hypothetical protein